MMNNEVLEHLNEQMRKTVISFETYIAKIRTGRATPSMLDGVMVDFYGTPTPICQTAQIHSPEPQQLVIKPYDKTQMGAILGGLHKADLGINPMVEADLIRIVVPSLTEEVRKDLVKKLLKELEQFKVQIRNHRRDANDHVKKNKELSENVVAELEEEIQKMTDKYIAELEKVAKDKEKELMTI